MDRRGFERGIELGQLSLGAGKDDLQAPNLTEPAFTMSFGDPIE
ncbi:hypothetical protein AB0C89_34345 [Streptomyces sp. NPDC048491]